MIEELAIFAKAPVAGHAKTRLTPPLSPEAAAAVHAASLNDVVVAARRTGARVTIFFDGAHGGEAYFAETFPHLRRAPQAAGDLGQRMSAAFHTLFEEGAPRAAIIGADSPTLPVDFLDAARRALEQADAVLGPTLDGGYYLIGIGRTAWPRGTALFRGVPWSSDRVLATSLQRAAEAGLRIGTMEAWYDIDRIGDLKRALADLEPGSALGTLMEEWKRRQGREWQAIGADARGSGRS